MSLKRVKNVFDNMSNAQDVLLQILQINTSKTGNISYIVRPIIFEPVDRMKQFLLEIREKYIDDKKDLMLRSRHVLIMMERQTVKQYITSQRTTY